MPIIHFQVQDRTTEFQSCVASISKLQQQHQQSRSPYTPTTAQNQQRSRLPTSQFGIKAKAISDEIAVATESLASLAKLARRKTLFDDRPVEIAELTYVVKQRVARCNQSIKDLQAYVKSQEANGAKKGKQKQGHEHSANVVVMLQGRLTSVTTLFEEVLETRLRNMQSNKQRTEQFIANSAVPSPQLPAEQFGSNNNNNSSATASSIHANGAMASGIDRESPLYSVSRSRGPPAAAAQTIPDSNAANPYAPHMESSEDYLTLPPDQHQSMSLLADPAEAYTFQRGQAVSAIESTIQELGGIFAQLASMVAEQRDVIQRIDADTEDISFHVQGAQRELLKYYRRVTSNRMLMIKMFGLLIFFFLIWVIVS